MKILLTILLLSVPVYAQKVKPASLSFEAALVYQDNSVHPIRRTSFILLNKSLREILYAAGLDAEGRESIAATYAFAIKNRDFNFTTKADAAIKPHVVQTTTTDFEGKGIFEGLKPGTYYLFGFSETRGRGFVIWNLSVDLKAGNNKIILDQNNADTAF